ncbi:MAG: Ada metal-binding domain-containing protein [Patescibacteria group bacterium]
MCEKLKSLVGDDSLYFAALLLLIAIASFGLGRQSVMQKAASNSLKNNASAVLVTPSQIVKSTSITPTPITTNSTVTKESSSVSGEVVASKSGTKYHLPTCSGAKSIKPENLITFATIAEAKAAGYTPAANCKGLQ